MRLESSALITSTEKTGLGQSERWIKSHRKKGTFIVQLLHAAVFTLQCFSGQESYFKVNKLRHREDKYPTQSQMTRDWQGWDLNLELLRPNPWFLPPPTYISLFWQTKTFMEQPKKLIGTEVFKILCLPLRWHVSLVIDDQERLIKGLEEVRVGGHVITPAFVIHFIIN